MEHLYIIADTDSCDSFSTSVCMTCPLAKLKKRPDGSWASCVSAVGFKTMGDGTYSKAALDLIIENLLTSENSENLKDELREKTN